MKNLIATIAVIALTSLCVSAQTNQVKNLLPPLSFTNSTTASDDVTKHDFMISGGGVVVPSTGESSSGLSVSLAINPFSSARSLWVGVSQSLAWEPFAGSTDFDANWSINIWGNLYTLPGWSAGASYDNQSDPVWRTGPELQVQYYVTDSVFLLAMANYDIVSRGNNDWRWSIGLGWEF